MSEIPQDPAAPSDPPPQQSSTPPPTPPPPAGQTPAYGAQAPVSPSDARMWSLFAHIGGLLTTFLVPLVIYLIYKDRDPFIRRHAAQALNFQIIIAIAYFVSSLLIFVVIGFITYPLAFIISVIFSIMAAMAANKGEEYTYPMVPQMVT
jgi:uncharacterized Tic20 family protein